MKQLRWIICWISCCFAIPTQAQFSKQIIQLRDKQGVPFSTNNPAAFLSQRSIARKQRYNIPVDETDLPISTAYLDSIRNKPNVKILGISKWMNQVCIQTTNAASLAQIAALPFVTGVTAVGARTSTYSFPIFNKISDGTIIPLAPGNVSARPQQPTDFYNYGLSYGQIHVHNGEFLHNHGFRGEGMQMAITDAGFFGYINLITFDSARTNNQILGTWDFVRQAVNVNGYASHGTQCFSTISANLPGNFVGSAPKSVYYLFVTEDVSSEYPVEEFLWIVGAERADSAGVDVTSVSLGYNIFNNSVFNYTYATDLTGNKTLITRGVNMAVKKGMSVVVAAGNEGASNWHYITAPGDADSAITVGGIDVNKTVASFSSFGPNADGQIKPDVAAVGANAVIVNTSSGQPGYGGGTSFACPIMAGLVTCLWQAFPEVNSLQLRAGIQQSADRFANPNDRSGYGVPDMKKAFVLLLKQLYQQQVTINQCKVQLNMQVKAAEDMTFFVEKKTGTDAYVPLTQTVFPGSFSNRNFSFSDSLQNLASGTSVTFRTGMIIGTDTTFYLDSARVQYTTSCAVIDPLPPVVPDAITVGPNPATTQIQVIVTRNKTTPISLVLYNSIGQQVHKEESVTVTGTRAFIIPMKQFSKGLYYLAIYANKEKILQKTIAH